VCEGGRKTSKEDGRSRKKKRSEEVGRRRGRKGRGGSEFRVLPLVLLLSPPLLSPRRPPRVSKEKRRKERGGEKEKEKEEDSPPGPETWLHGAVGVSGARCAGALSLPPPSPAEALAGLTSESSNGFVAAQGEGTAWQGSAASQASVGGAA
jgi:hypothetical protein